MNQPTCAQCGFASYPGDAFCRSCGTSLSQYLGSPTRPPIAQPPAAFDPAAPYAAAPQDPFPGAVLGQSIWREDRSLVFLKGADLPDRCIICNAPADSHLIKQIRWYHPLLGLVVLAGCIGLIVFVILTTVLSKKADASIGYCQKHFSRRRLWMAAGYGSICAGLFVALCGWGVESWQVALAGGVIFVFGIVAWAISKRYLQIQRIDDNYVWLKGVHPDYLAQFPSVGSLY